MARPSSSATAAASAEKQIFKNTGKIFRPFHDIGINPDAGNGLGVYNCDGLQTTVTAKGRPTFLSIDDRTTTPAETRSYSVKLSSVTRLDEDFVESGAPLTHDEGEALCAEIADRVESTRLEIKKEFSTDGSSVISDDGDDVNFFLRSEILAKHKEKMIPFIRDALRKNKEMIEAALANNPSVTPYEATLHIPELTFREAVTQLRSIDDEQLFAILNLGFDYDRAMRHKPYLIEIQYLEKIRKDDPTANLAAIYEELILHPTHKLLATCLGFSPEFVATVENNGYRSLVYLVELKQKLLDEGRSLKTVEEMTEIFGQTVIFTHKNQFKGLMLGLDVALAERLIGDEWEDNFLLKYLVNEVVGNRRISELPDEEKAKTIGEIFESIEGCENYPQCVAKRELGFSDEIIHSTTENMGIQELLIGDGDLENVNFVVNLKTKKPSLTVDELVAAYGEIIFFRNIQFEAATLGLSLEIAKTVQDEDVEKLTHLKKLKIKDPLLDEERLGEIYQKLVTFSDLQFEAMDLGLSLEIAERYFGYAEPHTNFQLSYLQNFRERNPETTDGEITAKFNEIRHLKGELQLKALHIGLSPISAQRFTIRSTSEERMRILENLKETMPDITDQKLETFCKAISDISIKSCIALEEELKKGLEIGLNIENLTQLTHRKNLAHFESLKKFIAESPEDLGVEAINTKFLELLKAGLDAPAPDAAGAGAAAVTGDRRSPHAL